MRTTSLLAAAGALTLLACGSSSQDTGFDDGGSSQHHGDGGHPNPAGDGGAGDDTGTLGPVGEGGPQGNTCQPNPANYDVPGNNCDDDGDGKVDNVIVCDTGLASDGSASDAIKAMGVCQNADATHWGVVKATFTHDYGQESAVNDAQHGILGKFGDVLKPREGQSLAVLSSGFGLEYDCNFLGLKCAFQNGQQMQDDGTLPAGFPKAAHNCSLATDVHDVIDLHLEIKVPANAQGIQFDFDFMSGEWPQWVCTDFNDGFIAYVKHAGDPAGDNISFDSANNPVSVNNAFFDRCTQNAKVGCQGTNSSTMACAGGPAELQGTGFYALGYYCTSPLNSEPQTTGGGATGWLQSHAPVKPGETIEVDFMIWDTHDQNYDSSVLLDHLTWVPAPVTAGTERPPQ